MGPNRAFQLIFTGDVMLGRLIDQLLPTHVHEPSEQQFVQRIKRSNPALGNYSISTPWGNVLPLLQSADLRLINLETSMTSHDIKWPNKVFNYRMHPANVEVLKTANIDYTSLANNHTLDFGEQGLFETVETLRSANISFAGAGLCSEEAQRPATITISGNVNSGHRGHRVNVFSASDHPSDWARVPSFHLIDYSTATKRRLKQLISEHNEATTPSLTVFSVHWGPNYSWQPAEEIRDLAHFLIDECGVDIIHGHSSHHVQGIERYKPGKLIIYGCGDFIEDYAVTPDYRNDLSAVWRVAVREEAERNDRDSLVVEQVEIFPTRINNFRAQLLDDKDSDHQWVRSKITALSQDMGYQGLPSSGEAGQLVFEI
ncbi:MAG: hypothetical protein M1821_009168 [Bathelium mastoideum]|nr:MAG: hypothetical protein M1821_009168 [Bathelium mastoideum]KAI9689511.1 MAG: hypothetical protein M1822_010162 [Bathelium mastoideum]